MNSNKYVKAVIHEKINIVDFKGEVGNLKEAWPSNSDEIIDLIIEEYDDVANNTKKISPKKQDNKSRNFFILGPAFSIVKSDLSILSIEAA